MGCRLTMPVMDAPDAKKSPQGSRALLLSALIGGVFCACMLALGDGSQTISRAIGAIYVLLNSAWLPAVYLLGSLGLGRGCCSIWNAKPADRLPTRWIIELGLGFTLMLSCSHALGVLGWLNPMTAWSVTSFGIALLIPELFTRGKSIDRALGRLRLTIPGIACMLGCTVAVLAATSLPGTLWESEFGGYDALSYHLELPREWLEGGRIETYQHNVYSFLPGYIEASYLHMAHLANAPAQTDNGLSGFLSNDARALMASQLLSAMLLIVSVLAIGGVVDRVSALYLHGEHRASSSIARVLVACTPWFVVVGSLAYNELGVVFLAIAAYGVVIERTYSISTRSILAGLIVGGACSCKPTAIFLLAPSVGVILLAAIPPRQWYKPIALCTIFGLLTIAPWLARNHIAAGNMVFPQLHALLGDGHWTDAQHALYSSAHRFEGSLLDRALMLVLPDSTGTHHVSQFRGWTNLQWGMVPIVGLVGLGLLLSRIRTHRLGFLLAIACLLPMLGWMMLTHLQSRFLIPIAPVLIGAGALGITHLKSCMTRRGVTIGVSALSVSALVYITGSQVGGNPFVMLAPGQEPWTDAINTIAEPGETVYLLGDASPLYRRSPIVYNTVYDHWLIEDAIALNPEKPEQWTAWLIDQGIDVIVVSFSEIDRFAHSGWLPDSIDPEPFHEWIDTLGEPIYVWVHPQTNTANSAAFRITHD